MLYLNDTYQKEFESSIKSINSNQIILNQTYFYAKSGGQPGDTGIFIIENNEIQVTDTIKDQENNTVHIIRENVNLHNNQKVFCKIDWNKRYKYMRMHTALHLLCSVIPYGVTGGQIGYEKSRLDFDLKDNIIDKNEIEERLNILVLEDHKIEYLWITNIELDKSPNLVRTMSVKPPKTNDKIRLVKIGNIDLQPCGGTHVKSTKEIGKITINKIENKGKKNRRINISLI
ncbi:MAG: Ala-tRNA(Pro) hydrolase [Pelagibacteraceae bacterium]|nr:Ala-tRNA(Pro) hydrolase [Pelagibacteraceae bacterium]|tara:strand:+ start:704 stop:1393 length:690 start_codon:yes stop_codon:yes gene_type:complete